MGTLTVDYDGSDCAAAALESAIELTRDTGDGLVIGFGYEPPGRADDP